MQLLAQLLSLSLSLTLTLLLAPAGFAGPLTSKGTQPGLVHEMESADGCENCHGDFEATSNHEPWPTWAGSMMANASRDPLFWAALDVANHDLPGVGDFCLRCHVPAGWLAGRSEPPGGSIDGCGFLGQIDSSSSDFEGVTCHLCHRMMLNSAPPPGQAPVYLENGQFWIDDSDCGGAGEPCRRGPYNYPADGADEPPHAWSHSPYHENSVFCGNCHNVTNPVKTLIVDGVNTGIKFPIERTFKEWAQSAYFAAGPSCQNCHMPDLQGSPAYSCWYGLNDHPGDLPIHEFAGGNAWIPEVLRLEYPNLGRDAEFAATRDAAVAMLESAAEVEILAPVSIDPGASFALDVKVTNLSGHKLPTGYPEGRRLWLHVEVRDGNGALLFESGAYDGASGFLTEDTEIKVYRAEPGIFDVGAGECKIDDAGGPQFHFVLNDCYRSDNRIPPLGFAGGADPETRPVAYAYPETSPGSGILVNYDITQYALSVPLGVASPVTATAVLRYQTASKEYVEFLRDEAVENAFPDDCIPRSSGPPTESRGEILHAMWEEHGRSAPVAMATAVAVIPVPEPSRWISLGVGLAFLAGVSRKRRTRP